MASAKFLEEALSTDVDESAVNAIVGSLEDQLVTTAPTASNQHTGSVTVNQNHMTSSISNGGTVTTQKHGVSNGGGSESVNIILNNDANKVVPSGTLQNSVALSSGVVNTVVASLQGGVPSSGFVNQTNIGLVQTNLTNVNKSQEQGGSVKLVYPSSSQAVTTSVGVNINNRVSYANQQSTVSSVSLPNGNITLTAHVTSSTVQNIVTQSYSQAGTHASKQIGSVVGMDQSKPTGTALVIKSSGTNAHGAQGAQLAAGVVPVNTTMTLAAGSHGTAINTTSSAAIPGVVTLTKPLNQPVGTQQTIVGNSPTIIPANVQILNVNTIRAGTPGQPGQKTLPPRVMIGSPQVVGTRQPGITLQALQQLQPGTQGHLLVKTENGQYQLLRVGPAATPTAAIAPNNATNTAFRVQSVPAVGGATAGNIQTQQVSALSGTTQASAAPASTATRPTVDTTKEKCRKFLANLLELSSREPKMVERNVRTLIQDLVDNKVEPEEFCDRLERLLNASPQPCLIGFLKKSLPLLRQSMVTNELIIDGIRPPPRSVVFSMTTTTPTVVQPQIQQTNQTTMGLTTVRPQVQMTTTPQMRVIAHPGGTPGTTAARPNQPLQHRIVTKYLQPMRMPPPVSKVMTAASGIGTVGAAGLRPTMVGGGVAARLSTPVRPPTAIIKTPAGTLAAQLKPGQTLAKASMPGVRPPSLATTAIVTSASPLSKTHTSSFLLKAVTASKEKEKKSYSSAGYTGDDDINDVAAMGGVNLAEETQRILGSTEFVGTQIRSCKDDLYLHSSPLVQKINQIASRHGLDEPPSDVAALVSHATQERLKTLVEKLAVIAEHRIDLNKADPQYEISQDVRGQLKFLEELDRAERKRHEEQERELLLRAAKSRSKSEDPEQAKLKAKAKEMQRAEMEELRQREANLTALQAIGSRKKPKLECSDSMSSSGQSTSGSASNSSNTFPNRYQLPSRPRLKRVNLRDLLFLLEQEKDTCRSNLLYRAHLK